MVQLYSFGVTPFALVGESAGWNLLYDSCPFKQTDWIQAAATANVLGHGLAYHVTGNWTYGCWPYRNNVTFGPWLVEGYPGGNGELVNSSISLGTDWGLVTWMTQLWANTSSGSPIPLANVSCVGGLGPASCRPNATGWFAVLQSTTGGWLDIYSSSQGRGQWEIPNVTLYSSDSLAVYLPGGTALAKLHLTMGATEPAVNLSTAISAL